MASLICDSRPLFSFVLISVETMPFNNLRLKNYNRALFICLEDNLSFHFTFPPVRPAAHCQKAFCWGQCGPIGATGIHKQRGQTKVTETKGPGTLPNEAGGGAASAIWGPSAD